jgi:hypothetical protein
VVNLIRGNSAASGPLKSQISNLRLVIVMSALACACGLTSDNLAAQPEGEAAATTETTEPAADSKSEDQSRKKRRVTAGLLTVALVTATGLALLAFTVLGGTATRRTLRRPDEEPEPRGSRPVVGDDVSREDEAGEPTESPSGNAESEPPTETRTPDETQE